MQGYCGVDVGRADIIIKMKLRDIIATVVVIIHKKYTINTHIYTHT